MSDLIFVGDVAIHDEDGIQINLPSKLTNSEWVINLEGAVTNSTHTDAVYNSEKGFKKLLAVIPVKVASLANNHIFDIDEFDNTVNFLEKENILYLGAGRNIEEAKQYICYKEYVFLNFGWSVIQCEIASENHRGTNPFDEMHILESFHKCKLQHPKKKIILLFHWNYEMELYPMPAQRDLAMKLIDEGAELIVGNHSHLVQGIEQYKGKYICHGLGNWAFRQGKFHQGKLSFLDSVLDQVAIEFSTNRALVIHRFKYDKINNSVDYIESLSTDSEYMKDLTPYQGMTSKDYEKYFRQNRLKTKGLPIYKSGDSVAITKVKNRYMEMRDLIIKVIFKFRK